MEGGQCSLFQIPYNVSFLRMVTNRAILAFIFLFGHGFAQIDAAQSSNSLQAEATVEIQYDGEVGSGIILMTTSPSCITSVPNGYRLFPNDDCHEYAESVRA